MCIFEEKLDEMTLERLEDFEYVVSSFSIRCVSHPIAQTYSRVIEDLQRLSTVL